MTKFTKTKAQMKSNMYYVFGVLAPLQLWQVKSMLAQDIIAMSRSHLRDLTEVL